MVKVRKLNRITVGREGTS